MSCLINQIWLKEICSALVSLSQVVHVERGGVVLKPLISIEYTTPTCIARMTFVSGVKVEDVVSSVPLDADYEPLNNLSNGKEKQMEHCD